MPLGALHEVLGAGADEEDGAAAAGFIAGILARLGSARREAVGKAGPGAGLVLWCLKRPDLYGPGLLAHGLDPARIVLVTARRGDEMLWAAEEALRAGPEAGLAAVVAEIGRLPMVAGRRLQLAAERSGVTAFLLRRWRAAAEAAAERERPSAALTRWRVTSLLEPWSRRLSKTIPSPGGGEGAKGKLRIEGSSGAASAGRAGGSSCCAFAAGCRAAGRWRSPMRRVMYVFLPDWPIDRLRRTGRMPNLAIRRAG